MALRNRFREMGVIVVPRAGGPRASDRGAVMAGRKQLPGRRATVAAVFGTGAVFAVAAAMTAQAPAQGAPSAQGWTPSPRPTAVVTGQTATPTTTPTAAAPTPDPTAGSTGSTTDPGPAQEQGTVDVAPRPTKSCPATVGPAVTRAPGAGRTVALTFDDGPGPDTPALLDLLRERGVRATFFLVGRNAAARPDLVARTAAEGHLIGDHSWAHRFPRQVAGGWTRAFLQQDVTRTEDVLTRASGAPVCWFRPPGGFLPPTVLPVAHGLGMQVALWSVDPKDWALQDVHGVGARLAREQISDRIVARVSAGLSQAHPLVLLHDGGGPRAATVAAVGRIIDLYQAHGYRFVRLAPSL